MVYVLAFIILFQTIVHFIERRELADRLMSRDLTEFKNEPIKSKYKSAHDKTIKKWRGEE